MIKRNARGVRLYTHKRCIHARSDALHYLQWTEIFQIVNLYTYQWDIRYSANKTSGMCTATVTAKQRIAPYVVLPRTSRARVEKEPAYRPLRCFANKIGRFSMGRGCHISVTGRILVSRFGEELDYANTNSIMWISQFPKNFDIRCFAISRPSRASRGWPLRNKNYKIHNITWYY